MYFTCCCAIRTERVRCTFVRSTKQKSECDSYIARFYFPELLGLDTEPRGAYTLSQGFNVQISSCLYAEVAARLEWGFEEGAKLYMLHYNLRALAAHYAKQNDDDS